MPTFHGGHDTTAADKMKYQIKTPCKRLAPYVKYYWLMESENIRHRERVLPTGEIQMLFHFKNPFREFLPGGRCLPQPQSVVCGQTTSFKDVETAASCSVIGVTLFPYAAGALLPVPLHEITDHITHPADFSPAYSELEDQLMECNCPEHGIQLVENHLVRQLPATPGKYFNILFASIQRIQRIPHSGGQAGVMDILKELGIPERRFQRIFRSHIGISPRQYMEITKFNHARSLMESSLNLTKIAFQAGYYDQPQLNRAFKKYAGLSPGTYRSMHC
ncbi:MAG: AraC family transcriptional regulator, partial [bacterium]|nr:AraC family transcriptional regulator [bacterium]